MRWPYDLGMRDIKAIDVINTIFDVLCTAFFFAAVLWPVPLSRYAIVILSVFATLAMIWIVAYREVRYARSERVRQNPGVTIDRVYHWRRPREQAGERVQTACGVVVDCRSVSTGAMYWCERCWYMFAHLPP